MKEVVVSCVRVALKDRNKLIDEQTKDYWKWRDTILFSEDVILESLCFDLSVESPYKAMYGMLKYYCLEHDKTLRNGAWAFLSDSCLTECCLLFTARTIAAASVYAGARLAGVSLPPDDNGRPWWEVQHVQLKDIRRCCDLMANIYEQSPTNGSEPTVYDKLRSPDEIDMKTFQTPVSGSYGESGAQQNDVNTDSATAAAAVNGNENEKANANAGANGEGDRNAGVADDGSEEGELDG
jgi:protein BUR2